MNSASSPRGRHRPSSAGRRSPRAAGWHRVGVNAAALAVAMTIAASGAQSLFTDALPREEFAERRARLMDAIGDDVAVVQGASEYPGYVTFRQNNQFYYLTGVEVPRALVLVDGRERRTTVYLSERDEVLENSEGPRLVPGTEAERLTGIDAVVPRSRFNEDLAAVAREGRTVHTPARPESLIQATPTKASDHAIAALRDPWEGRPSRVAAFREALTRAAPGLTLRDLDPVLDRLRLIKSPAEIRLIREATRISGDAIMESIRVARPGMYEYELAAIGDYVFARNGARGPAYFALVAAGVNAYYPHYHALDSRLEAGDLVLYDYAPDYHYYASDVTRMFPASGTFADEDRELYTVYLRLYQVLLESIRPHVSPGAMMQDAVARMERRLGEMRVESEAVRSAAERFVADLRSSGFSTISHYVGMEVHDVAPAVSEFAPGMVFTIEPALTIPEDRVYVRLEDVILVTESGYENLSAFVPVEPEDIERLMAEDPVLVREPGLALRPSVEAR